MCYSFWPLSIFPTFGEFSAFYVLEGRKDGIQIPGANTVFHTLLHS